MAKKKSKKEVRIPKVPRRKKGPVQSKAVEYNGIKFKSTLEKNCYKALRDAKLDFEYELKSYQTNPPVVVGFKSYEQVKKRDVTSFGEVTNKIRNVSYTPDFEGDFNGFKVFIECKGRANESFPLRWKLFKNYLKHRQDESGENIVVFQPHNISQINEMIEIILSLKI